MTDETKNKRQEPGPGGGGPPARGSAFWDVTFYLGPDLIIVVLFTAALVAMRLVYGGKTTFMQGPIVYPIVLFLIIAGSAFAARIRRIFSGDLEQRREFFRLSMEMIRDWSPIVIIGYVYENFSFFTIDLRPVTMDAELRRIDELIFGVEPTLALQAITVPWFTEYMTFVYALYFVIPSLILGVSYFRGEFFKFREIGLALAACFYLGLLGYIAVPAIGPRYFMTGEFAFPLTGIWLTERAAAIWDSIEVVKRDCFPSLHTAISTIGLIYLWRYRGVWRGGRVLLWVCTPLIVSLWFSTVYLRYHWTVDVFAGWVLAFFCAYTAPWFVKWYYRKKTGVKVELSLDVSRSYAGRPGRR